MSYTMLKPYQMRHMEHFKQVIQLLMFEVYMKDENIYGIVLFSKISIIININKLKKQVGMARIGPKSIRKQE